MTHLDEGKARKLLAWTSLVANLLFQYNFGGHIHGCGTVVVDWLLRLLVDDGPQFDCVVLRQRDELVLGTWIRL